MSSDQKKIKKLVDKSHSESGSLCVPGIPVENEAAQGLPIEQVPHGAVEYHMQGPDVELDWLE